MELLSSFRQSWKKSKSLSIHSVKFVKKKTTNENLLSFDERRQGGPNDTYDSRSLKQSALTQRAGGGTKE